MYENQNLFILLLNLALLPPCRYDKYRFGNNRPIYKHSSSSTIWHRYWPLYYVNRLFWVWWSKGIFPHPRQQSPRKDRRDEIASKRHAAHCQLCGELVQTSFGCGLVRLYRKIPALPLRISATCILAHCRWVLPSKF